MKTDIEDMDKVFHAVKGGDRKAFEFFFRTYYVPLCDYAFMILGEQQEAEDVVQDLFTYIWENRAEVEVKEAIKSYLFTAVRFRALNVLKHRMIRRKHGVLLSEFLEDLMCSDYSEEETERIRVIGEVLKTLPVQCRKIFTMNCLEGKKYKEIAEELGISVNTVKSHVVKAYREIRNKIHGQDIPILLYIALNYKTHAKNFIGCVCGHQTTL